MWGVFGLMIFIVIGLSALWVKGISDIDENHPDYKGKGDGFDFDDYQHEDRKDYDEN